MAVISKEDNKASGTTLSKCNIYFRSFAELF